MRLNYISQIKSNLKKSAVISTRRPTANILDGSYLSVYKGRSLNFDDLREYVPGDDVKDIDWKASARSNTTLVREYIAEKKHNLMIVFDTNKRMMAHTSEGQEKYQTALYAAGTLAYMVSRNGEYISSVFSDGRSMKFFPFKSGLMNVERILEAYDRSVGYDNESDISDSLDYIMRNIRRRMIIVIVTDMEGKRSISEKTLKRLNVLHDVLLMNVTDSEAFGKDIYDVDSKRILPDFFTTDRALQRRERARKDKIRKESDAKLKRTGVVFSDFSSTEGNDVAVTELLAKHKLEKK